jgi:hypothetical protein
MRRRLARVIVGAALAVGLLAGAGKVLLRSAYAAEQVTARLGAAVGAPVRVREMDLGFTASDLRDVDVLERETAASPPAWVSVGVAEVDLSLWQLLTGDLGGGTVTVRRATVNLAFDRNNRLVTRLPQPPAPAGVPLPVVRVEGGQFTLRREGFPDETFHNITLEVRSDGRRLTLAGTVHDPDWGEWTASGGQDAPGGPFTLVLRTVRPVHATPALLRRAPFVPPSVWRQVQCEGDTPCELTLRFEPGAPRPHYRVELAPTDTRVHVTAIDLTAEAARGRVIVEDDVVTLETVRGLAAGGDLRVGSTMDFRGEPDVLKFAVEADVLNPRRMPARWNVPPLPGQVAGRADLEVLIHNGRATTRGRGHGTVRAFPLLAPIHLGLEADGRGFRFTLGRG